MACNKIAYETKSLAKKDSDYISAQTGRYNKRFKKKRHVKLTPYQCGLCGNWHLTSMKQGKKFLRSKNLID